MERDILSDAEIKEILSLNSVAVVGMSKDPSKAAHFVPRYLSENGFDVTPVNPNADTILGKRSHDVIADVREQIDIVNVFRPSDQVLTIVRQAVKKRPKVIWLQEGIHNAEAEELARNAGSTVVFNRCIMQEHRRLA